jgi:hypothetical protein
MVFGSWVYNSDELTLDYFENMRNVDLNDYVPSGTWDLIEVPASIEYYNETYTNKTKVQMVYRIKMRRKSLFYLINIIIPTFLISFLSVCVFYLPTDDGEKIPLSLSILFAIVVFFLLISKIIPPTSIVVPLISKYLLFIFMMNILSILNTSIVIGFYFKELKLSFTHPLFRFIFLKVLPNLLFIKRKQTIEKFYARKAKSTSKEKAASKEEIVSCGDQLKKPYACNLNLSLSNLNINSEYEYMNPYRKRPINGNNSPLLLRTNTLKRYKHAAQSTLNVSQYETTLTANSKTQSNLKNFEHKLLNVIKANSQHDMILAQESVLHQNGGDVGGGFKKKKIITTIKKSPTTTMKNNNDLIIEAYLKDKFLSEKNKQQQQNNTTTNKIHYEKVNRESLYDLNKLKKSPEIRKRFKINQNNRGKNTNNLNDSSSKERRSRQASNSPSKKTDKKTNNDSENVKQKTQKQQQQKKIRIITFESFRLTDKFQNLCQSVDYISNIYKTKAELNDVRIAFLLLLFE